MKYISSAFLAALCAPGAVSARGFGSSYLVSRPLILQSPTARLLRQQEAFMNKAISHSRWSSPRYEITDNDERFELAVDVPGVKLEDIDITLDDGVLMVRGQREASDSSYSFTSTFSQSFALDPSVDVDKFTATLNNGVLIVSAPKDMKRIEQNVRKIPITEMRADPEIRKDVIDVCESSSEEKNRKDHAFEAEIKAGDDLNLADKQKTPA